jgi:hypothetical protein
MTSLRKRRTGLPLQPDEYISFGFACGCQLAHRRGTNPRYGGRLLKCPLCKEECPKCGAKPHALHAESCPVVAGQVRIDKP